MADNKFYKYTYTVTVLSDEPRKFGNLSQIDYAITDGGCVGNVDLEKIEELTGPEMAEALCDVGSEPGFFQLDDKGNKVDDDWLGGKVD